MNVLLAEDHKILREGMKSLLRHHDEITIIAEANNGKEAIEKVEQHQVDLIIMDLNMPIMSGLETVRYLREKSLPTKVLILSMFEHEKYIIEIIREGASGYLLKTCSNEELVYAIQHVHSGEIYISSHIALNLLNKISDNNLQIKDVPLSVNLSGRELEVLTLISEGYTNTEIAEKLFISRRTIESHRKHLLEKTYSKNTAALIKFALCHGLIK